MDPPDNPFWRFSFDRYGSPGVAEICLTLQELHGADVNLVLFCIWLAEGGRQLSGPDQARELVGIVDEWNGEVVVPLRRVRRFMKDVQGGADAFREQLRRNVKIAELGTERIEQAMLHRHFTDEIEQSLPRFVMGLSAGTRALANLRAYFEALGRDFDEGLESELKQLVALSVGDRPEDAGLPAASRDGTAAN